MAGLHVPAAHGWPSSAVALPSFITKQNIAVASPQYQRGAQAGRSAADDENIEFHAEHLSFATI